MKAAGIDWIQMKLWKKTEEKVKKNYLKLSDIYETGEMPEDYVKFLIIPIPKKTGLICCQMSLKY